MNTLVALFRGINVGGNNILPMKELAQGLASIGLENIKTYIQSGNVVFQSASSDLPKLSKRITETVQKNHGFSPQVMLFTAEQMQSARDNNPFAEAADDPKTLHMFFLAEKAQHADLDLLDQLKTDNEQFQLTDAVFYLHAPDGIGRSKLAAKAEKALGVATTARNWRTVNKILMMV
ncbi:DUF1697 domain-containing protein [Marinicella sp. W31]|uniref:DUF1697 domain-containing protein n=1 Tax=Marinicella sp. W31 TaxID=3023713 RepID=UPI0037579305